MPISCTTAMDINTSKRVGQVLEQLIETLEKGKNSVQKVRDSGEIEAADFINEVNEEQMELYRKLIERNDRWEPDSEQGIQNAPKVLEYFGLSLYRDDAEDDDLESIELDENDPIQKKIMSGDKIMRVAGAFADTIVFEDIEVAAVFSLAITYERLEKWRKKFRQLQNCQASTVKLNIAAKLYFSDAYNYIETVNDIVVRSLF
ncbi:hypothetical protein H0H93_000702 [Arthromyces matolae]|nr:hypothetical protein H0H93_000702 [Arthromyces matolae]